MSYLPCIPDKLPNQVEEATTQTTVCMHEKERDQSVAFSAEASPPAAPPAVPASFNTQEPLCGAQALSKQHLKRLKKQSQHAKATAGTILSPPTSSSSSSSVDAMIQHTNDDSVVSKRSAVALGYVDDPFVRYFVRKPSRRSPLINRGYYLRMAAMTDALTQCISQLSASVCVQSDDVSTLSGTGETHWHDDGSAGKGNAEPFVQVISLGAGFDTFAFRCLLASSDTEKPPRPQQHHSSHVRTRGEANACEVASAPASCPQRPSWGAVHFYDVDFPAVMQNKAALMCVAPYGTFPPSWRLDPTNAHVPAMGLMSNGSRYYAVGANLRIREYKERSAAHPAGEDNTLHEVSSSAVCPGPNRSACSTASQGTDWLSALRAASATFSCTAPTLLYAECVLQYLAAEDAAALLVHMARSFPHAVLLTYDQLHHEDSFGAVMTQSLRQRGSALLGLSACADESAMSQRARVCGLPHVRCANFYDLSRRWVAAPALRAWMSAREPFDELEEWSEMCEHYGITLASNDAALFARCAAVLPDYHDALGKPSTAIRRATNGNHDEECSNDGTRSTPASTGKDSPPVASRSSTVPPLAKEMGTTHPTQAMAVSGMDSPYAGRMESWPSGRWRFEGWGNGSTMVEHVHRRGVSDVLLIAYGGFSARQCHQRVSDVVCHSVRHGMLTVVVTRSVESEEQVQEKYVQHSEHDKGREHSTYLISRTIPALPALIFHSLTRVAPLCYVVYGGRTNPACPSNEAFLLECSLDERGTTLSVRWSLLKQISTPCIAMPGAMGNDDHCIKNDSSSSIILTPFCGEEKNRQTAARAAAEATVNETAHAVANMPKPRYRHCAVSLPGEGGTCGRFVIYGGRDGSGAMLGDGWLATVDARHHQLHWRALNLVPSTPLAQSHDNNDVRADTSRKASTSAVPPAMCATAGVALSSRTLMLCGGLLTGEECSGSCWLLTLDADEDDALCEPAKDDSRRGERYLDALRCVCRCVPLVDVGARFAHTLTRVRMAGVAGILVFGGCGCEPKRSRDPAVFIPVEHHTPDTHRCAAPMQGRAAAAAAAAPHTCACGTDRMSGAAMYRSSTHGSHACSMHDGNGSESALTVCSACSRDSSCLALCAGETQQLRDNEWVCGCGGGVARLSSSGVAPVRLSAPGQVPSLARHDCVRMHDDDPIHEGADEPLVALWAAESPQLCAAVLPHASGSRNSVLGVVGGGYVCFSFGTFTPRPSMLHLTCDASLSPSAAALATPTAKLRLIQPAQQPEQGSSSLTQHSPVNTHSTLSVYTTRHDGKTKNDTDAVACHSAIRDSVTDRLGLSKSAHSSTEHAASSHETSAPTHSFCAYSSARTTRSPATPFTPAWYGCLLSLPRPAVVEKRYSAETFVRVVSQASGPVVFRNVALGNCLQRWCNPDYLCRTMGDTIVSVHVARGGPTLDFVRKNFRFAHVGFGELVQHVLRETAKAKASHCGGDEGSLCGESVESNFHSRHKGNSARDSENSNKDDTNIQNDDAGCWGGDHRANKNEESYASQENEVWYFRSIAARMKTERANLWHDFPVLADDFVLPPGAREYILPRMHQSCLRFNAPPLQLWTHYDTLDNVLCQVVGRKRVVFFPPSAYNDLYMSGSSSAVVNMDAPDIQQYPRFVEACRQALEVTLEPGDMLYFPAQWLHHITTLQGDYSISVNVFFDHFDRSEYDAKDLYGNKDLPACVCLRRDIVAAVTTRMRETRQTVTGDPMPPEYTEFALRQAIRELEGIADSMAAVRRVEREAGE